LNVPDGAIAKPLPLLVTLLENVAAPVDANVKATLVELVANLKLLPPPAAYKTISAADTPVTGE
jgi:hypothetical protein